jgi:glycosyltransferase involved in cell wall biosynthesis
MNSTPLISVILPTYNRLDFLPETVESILNQTFSDFELIIINDGSTDNTESWVKEQTDERIRYIGYSKNQGVSYARNQGLDAARGKYIAFIDSDDINEKTRFEKQVAVLEADIQIAVCSSNIQYFGLRKEVLKYKEKPLPFRIKALFQTPFHFPASMMRRSFLEKENIRFRPEIQSADDYYFLMKIMAKGKAVVIQKTLYQYRWHEGSISLKKRKEQDANALAISQMAFEDILNLKLNDVELNSILRFYRRQSLPKEKKLVDHIVQKLIDFTNQHTNLSNDEKRALTNFLIKQQLHIEKKWFQLLIFSIKKEICNPSY